MAKISKRKPRPIAVFDEKTMSLKLEKKKFKKKFDDGTPITSFEIRRMGKNLYFVRSGRDRKRNCHIWRTKVKFTKDGQVVFMQPGGGISESCTGDPCTFCAFVEPRPGYPTQGCICQDKKGKCNHTISRNNLADFGVFARR
jgi:hypothetical protein